MSEKETFGAGRFDGFPRSFYDAIPFAEDSDALAPDFCEAAKRLSSYREIDKILRESGLPDDPALQKRFQDEPGLLFYLAEIRALPFSDSEHLLTCLNFPHVYPLLARLHLLPGLALFFSDLAKAQGEEILLALLENDSAISGGWLSKIAGVYFLLPEEKQRQFLNPKTLSGTARKFAQMRNTVSHQLLALSEGIQKPDFSLPFRLSPNRQEAEIGDYRFCEISSLREAQRIWKELKPDDEIWWFSLPEPGDPNVYPVGVWNGRRAAAILTVRYGEIIRGRMSNQAATDPPFMKAVREYAKQTGLRLEGSKKIRKGGNTK